MGSYLNSKGFIPVNQAVGQYDSDLSLVTIPFELTSMDIPTNSQFWTELSGHETSICVTDITDTVRWEADFEEIDVTNKRIRYNLKANYLAAGCGHHVHVGGTTSNGGWNVNGIMLSDWFSFNNYQLGNGGTKSFAYNRKRDILFSINGSNGPAVAAAGKMDTSMDCSNMPARGIYYTTASNPMQIGVYGIKSYFFIYRMPSLAGNAYRSYLFRSAVNGSYDVRNSCSLAVQIYTSYLSIYLWAYDTYFSSLRDEILGVRDTNWHSIGIRVDSQGNRRWWYDGAIVSNTVSGSYTGHNNLFTILGHVGSQYPIYLQEDLAILDNTQALPDAWFTAMHRANFSQSTFRTVGEYQTAGSAHRRRTIVHGFSLINNILVG